MADKTALKELIHALRILPGVGERSAQRMAYYLLQNDRSGALTLAQAITHAVEHVHHCKHCHTLTDHDVCEICADPARDVSLLCVVETVADQDAMERTHTYRGLYYVLMGRLSPLDGIGPQEIGLQALYARCLDGKAKEVILATNFTATGEATAYVISEYLKKQGLKVTRLARGVPAGAELEYVDLGTIAHAFADRRGS